MESTQLGQAPEPVVRAVRRMLRPLVRLLIRFGISYPALSNLLKTLYVEVADTDFPVDGRPQTISRITVLTGVHRKDVKRILDQVDTDPAILLTPTLGAQIIGKWAGDPRFSDTDGRPRPLPRTGHQNGETFETLVASVSKDVRPRAVLDEWLRLGIATLDDDGRVALNTAAFVPSRGLEEKAHYFGRNLRDHIAAAAHNVAGDGAPLFERAVFYDGLTAASVDALRGMAEEGGMDLLLRINREALRLAERDAGDPENTERMTVGIFFFREDETAASAVPTPAVRPDAP